MTDDSLLTRIYRLKLILTGVILVVLGLVASTFSDWLDSQHGPHLLVALVRGLSDVLLVTGAIGIAIDFFTGRDKAAADTERTRQVLKELTPDFVDAVVKGFSANKADLKRVATPELLDEIATNALALRLGDDQFAREVYTDIRDSAIRTPERWYDVDVSIRLSSIDERSTVGAPLIDVLVSWEYTVTPSHPVQRFACTSDRDEFHELVTDVPGTATWLMLPGTGIDASDRAAFELLSFSVDGEDRTIRRSTRHGGQTYSATIGDDIVAGGRPVRIRHAYRTVIDASNHRLFLAIAQPARHVAVSVDYSAASISRMSVTDLMPGAARPYVSQLPAQAKGKELTVEIPGWVQAGTGITFVWTLASEEPAPAHPKPAKRAA